MAGPVRGRIRQPERHGWRCCNGGDAESGSSRASPGPPPRSRGLRDGSAWGRPTLSGWRPSFPYLRYDREAGVIVGELEVRAAYDREQGRLRIGSDDATASMDSYLSDSFSIRIDLAALDRNGWPAVFEVSGRYARVAERENVETIDLHFFPNGACCLGLQLLGDRRTTLKEFMDELVVPFFYRLAYTDLHGLAASWDSLWTEYSHGDQGLREYLSDVARIAAHRPRQEWTRVPVGASESTSAVTWERLTGSSSPTRSQVRNGRPFLVGLF